MEEKKKKEKKREPSEVLGRDFFLIYCAPVCINVGSLPSDVSSCVQPKYYTKEMPRSGFFFFFFGEEMYGSAT